MRILPSRVLSLYHSWSTSLFHPKKNRYTPFAYSFQYQLFFYSFFFFTRFARSLRGILTRQHAGRNNNNSKEVKYQVHNSNKRVNTLALQHYQEQWHHQLVLLLHPPLLVLAAFMRQGQPWNLTVTIFSSFLGRENRLIWLKCPKQFV